MVGKIYGYQSCDRAWQYVGQTIRSLAERHQQHRKGHRGLDPVLRLMERSPQAFIGPLLLEEISGADQKDLQENLCWAEIAWMFRLKTYRPSFERGWNFTLPFGNDYRGMGLVGGNVTKRRYSKPKRVPAKPWYRPQHRVVRIDFVGKNASEIRTILNRENSSRAGLRCKELHPEQICEAMDIGRHKLFHIRREHFSPYCRLCWNAGASQINFVRWAQWKLSQVREKERPKRAYRKAT